MQRILMRAGKSPFELYSGYETFDTNLIGNNNGNLIFAAAAHKLLSAEGVDVRTRLYGFNASIAPRVNEQFDAFVLPLANAFRPTFEPELKRLTAFINSLEIPTVMLSGGAQSQNGSFDHLSSMRDSIDAFCRAVLKKSSHITVRGERTAEYLRSLGFNDVMVIGCPSMTMRGRTHRVGGLTINDRFRVAYNIEALKDITGELVEDIESNHDATYFPQETITLEMMLWGIDKHKKSRDSRLPLYMDHAQFQHNKAEFYLDAYPWIQRMRDFDFSVGPRIHGNIVSILSGRPAVVLAHDSRTEELSEYHEIPHFKAKETPGLKKLDDVVDRIDFSNFNNGHAARVDRVVGFLNDNGIKTIYDQDQKQALLDYEKRLDSTNFPAAQKCEWAGMSLSDRERMRKQRLMEVKLAKLTSENAHLKRLLRAQANSLAPAVKF